MPEKAQFLTEDAGAPAPRARGAAAGVAATARSGRRNVLFLLSPRVIDFDTFLPTAMELKARRPGWALHFVTFSAANDAFIRRNPTLVEGLRRCGTLHYLGSEGARGAVARHARRLRALARLAGWLVASSRPVMFLARPFSSWPYNLLYLIGRLRGGRAILLWKSRSPDRVHHIVWQNRAKPGYEKRSWLARLMPREIDGLVYYHEDQSDNVRLSDRFGRIDNAPWRSMGFPHLLPAWRRLIDDQTAVERERLRGEGVPADAEFYAMFAAKAYSAVNLRDEDAVARSFHLAITTLCRLRPKAVVLIRPHPLALDEAYVARAIEAVGADRARLSFAHPEVLLALSRRAIFNNPTNIMFSCFDARLIDASDYPDSHYAESGKVSLAHGYGPVFVDPRDPDFEARFGALLADDAPFGTAEVTARRDALLTANPGRIEPVLELVGG